MAIGDEAAASGLPLVSGTLPANQIDTELNRTRDQVATFGVKPGTALPITRGGTGGKTQAEARTNLGVGIEQVWKNSGAIAAGTAPTLGYIGSGRIQFEVPGYAYPTTLANYADVGGVSSRRFKKYIKALTPDLQAILAMQLVQFQYKVAVEQDQTVQVGLIAEDLHDLGLDWLVEYDDEGLPAGVKYFRIALALLPVIQDHAARIADLETRITALEDPT